MADITNIEYSEEPATEENEEPQDPSFIDTVKAKWTTSTTNELIKGVSIGRFDDWFGTSKDEDLDVEKELNRLNITDENEKKLFSDVRTQEEFDNALNYMEEIKRSNEIINNAGAFKSVAASLVAGAVDPINVAMTVAAFYTGGGALAWGGRLARSATLGASMGAVDTAVEGEVLHGEVQADNVLKNAAVGAMFAPIAEIGFHYAGKAIKPVAEKLKDGLIEMMTPAIQWSQDKFKDGLQKLSFQIKNPTPILQTMNSEDAIVREFGASVFESPLNKDLSSSVAIETELKLFNSYDIGIAKEAYLKNRKNFIKANIGTKEEFNYMVGASLAKGEKSGDLFVDKAVDALMKPADKVTNKAVKVGLIEKQNGISTSKNRLVLNDEISKLSFEEISSLTAEDLSKYNVTTETARLHVRRNFNDKIKTDKILQKKAYELIKKSILLNNHSEKPLTANEIDAMAYKAVSRIAGLSPTPSGREQVTAVQSLINSRNIAINDAVLYNEGILEFNADNYLTSLNSVYTEALFDELAQTKFKSNNFKDFLNNLKKNKEIEHGEKIALGQDVIKTAEINDYNYKLVGDIYDLFTGNYTGTGAFKNNAILKKIVGCRTVCAMGSLGNIFLTSITDIAKPLLMFDFSRVMKAYAPFKSELKQLSKETLLHFAGLADRMRSQGGTGYITKIGAKEHEWTYWINKASGQNWLETEIDGAVLQMQYSDIIKASLQIERATGVAHILKQAGITKEYAQHIAKAFKQYGKTFGGEMYVDPVHIGNSDCVRRLQGSLRAFADDILYKASYGNSPRAMQSDLGQILFMFKKYAYQLYTHLYSPLMAGRISKSRALEALVGSVALSVLSRTVKNTLNGKDTDFSSKDFWKDVFEYSDFNMHVTDGFIQAVNAFSPKRFGSTVSSMSPFTSFIDRAVRNVNGILAGRPNYKATSQMIPGLNLWFLRPITSQLPNGKRNNRRKRI